MRTENYLAGRREAFEDILDALRTATNHQIEQWNALPLDPGNNPDHFASAIAREAHLGGLQEAKRVVRRMLDGEDVR